MLAGAEVGPSLAYQLLFLHIYKVSTLVSMLVAKLHRNALLSQCLAPCLTFMGNTTPEWSEQFRGRTPLRV